MSSFGCNLNGSTQHFILRIKRWSVSMAYRIRRNYTVAQMSELWGLWQKGETLKAIGRVFDRPSSSIFNLLSPTGVIRLLSRRLSRLALTLREREEISRGLISGLSLRCIRSQLSRSPSTICREVASNGGLKQYRASQAYEAAWDRVHRPKPCKLALHPELSRYCLNVDRFHRTIS
jgi:hypothetical protein